MKEKLILLLVGVIILPSGHGKQVKLPATHEVFEATAGWKVEWSRTADIHVVFWRPADGYHRLPREPLGGISIRSQSQQPAGLRIEPTPT